MRKIEMFVATTIMCLDFWPKYKSSLIHFISKFGGQLQSSNSFPAWEAYINKV